MAESNIQNPITLKAAGDLSGCQYHMMKISAVETAALSTAVTDKGIGVLQNKPAAAGRAATVANQGISKVVAGGAVTAGQVITVTTSGRAAAITSGTASVAFGRALQTSTTDGEIISVNLFPPVLWVGAN